MTIWEKLSNLDKRVYYVLLLLAVALPLLKPWGLPIMTSEPTESFVATIDALPPGAVVAFSGDHGNPADVETGPQVRALCEHVMGKDLKLIIWATEPQGSVMIQPVASEIAERNGKTYGVDWVNLGFKPGYDVVRKMMTEDFWGAMAGVDMFGTSLSNLPIMANFRTLKDADLLVAQANTVPSASESYLKMAGIPYKIPIVVMGTAMAVPSEMPYYSAGQYKGLVAGARGAAEYELLIEKPGMAITVMDAQSAAHILFFVLICLGNLGYFMTRRASKTTEGSEG